MDYAKLYPVIAFKAHGALGKWWIHKQYGMTKVVCKYAYPYNPKTVIQQTPRNFFAYAVNNWQGFDNPTKDFYNTNFHNPHMSGYNRYISLYLKAYSPSFIYEWSDTRTEWSDTNISWDGV